MPTKTSVSDSANQARSATTRRAVIIGGGFSGSLMAINLVRHAGPEAILLERGGSFARGLAYSTTHAGHLLNVRATNMSAFPDQPDHFVPWLEREEQLKGSAFAPRAAYGRYLAQILELTHRASPHQLRLRHDEAVSIKVDDGVNVQLRSGEVIEADYAVLALGNLPPPLPFGLGSAELGDRYVGDPWSTSLAAGLTAEDHVLIIGTGLTMVDVALSLEAQGYSGKITAISRRGLLPRVHSSATSPQMPLKERPTGEVSDLLKFVRLRSREIGWRSAIDELRPFTQAIWQAASQERRARFLRHLRPWWDVHRHRLAPDVAERIDSLRSEARLMIERGRTRSFARDEGKVVATWLPSGCPTQIRARFSRVINCTGPLSNLAQSEEPILQDLVAKGLACPDALGMGIAVNKHGQLLDTASRANPIYALGPMTRGAFWEITSVPDIRKQVWDVARRLSNAHWVEGHGL